MALHSVKSYAQANPAYTEPALRFFIFSNFAELLKSGAISKQGRKLIINSELFTAALLKMPRAAPKERRQPEAA